jgi:hypothetical protein
MRADLVVVSVVLFGPNLKKGRTPPLAIFIYVNSSLFFFDQQFAAEAADCLARLALPADHPLASRTRISLSSLASGPVLSTYPFLRSRLLRVPLLQRGTFGKRPECRPSQK